METNEYTRLVTARDIAMQRRAELKIETDTASRHIKNLEKLLEKEEDAENKRAELLVLSSQRRLASENKAATLLDGIEAALKEAGPRDERAIQKSFAELLKQNGSKPTDPIASSSTGQSRFSRPESTYRPKQTPKKETTEVDTEETTNADDAN